MSVYRITDDDYVLQEKSEEEIFIVDPEVTEIRCDINIPRMQINLFQMTDGVKYINTDFFVQGIDKFRIVSKDTGEVIVESEAFMNEDSFGMCDALMDFCWDYNENPSETIEALKNGEYGEEL